MPRKYERKVAYIGNKTLAYDWMVGNMRMVELRSGDVVRGIPMYDVILWALGGTKIKARRAEDIVKELVAEGKLTLMRNCYNAKGSKRPGHVVIERI